MLIWRRTTVALTGSASVAAERRSKVSAAREIAEILREELALSPKKRNSPKKSANEKDKEGE